MGIQELHSFCDEETSKLPQKPGVYVLFQVQNPLYADSAINLRTDIREAKKTFPRATHFSVEMIDAEADVIAKRVRQLREQLKLVRLASFVGREKE